MIVDDEPCDLPPEIVGLPEVLLRIQLFNLTYMKTHWSPAYKDNCETFCLPQDRRSSCADVEFGAVGNGPVCDDHRDGREQREFHAAMIQEQLKNVGKLVVTEANYSEVFSYADSKKFYFDMFSSDKKVLVIVDAQASISYDLSKVKTKIDTRLLLSLRSRF